MAAPKIDPSILAHREWLNFVQPTGLVVSPPALVRAGAILDRNDAEGQRLLRECIERRVLDPEEEEVPILPDFATFARKVLGWSLSPKVYAGTAEAPVPPELEVPSSEPDSLLRPDFAVREIDPREGSLPWQLLVQVLPLGEDFDLAAHGRLERLLRATRIPAGLLYNGRALRLLSAPAGESSGWLDFKVADMVKTDGRSICTALRLLLSEVRLLSLPRNQRFAALLEDSRKFQNEVSERLAEQVLHALYELLRGFQAAHDSSGGELLRAPLANHPDEVYRALLTVILRLVFLLYAEERDMLPKDGTFQRFYSLAGLYDRLREDAALFPDTLDQRYGAWAQLLVLFRMIYNGADYGEMRLTKRHGALFDPDRFPFLEGRRSSAVVQTHERIEPPRVPDGTIYRALEKLLVLDGERISYRALDVEQIGSVYETMMGFRLETATGPSLAVKAQKKQGAPTAVDLEALLRESPAQRDKWLQDRTSRKLTDKLKDAVKAAASIEALHSALRPVMDSAATPDLVQPGAMVLQPSEERRRSGSHYTPRSLTEPIVRTTLEPILARLRGVDGRPPRPEEILDLKVCDPAMGSGAFLVEACRQLGDALVDSWRHYGEMPPIPPDEDEVIYARRRIAQRCIYGVDRNPVAVDLAKVSLWLVTLARDHPLTFLDHALRHGDSLVGLSRRQIEAFHWDESRPPVLRGLGIRDSLDAVRDLRKRIREAGEDIPDLELRDWWERAQVELKKVRILGDLVLAAFFEGDGVKAREAKRNKYVSEVLNGAAEDYRSWLEEWRDAVRPLAPFHWETEFPEVFERGEDSGFDAFVGNPPFLGGTMVSTRLGEAYRDWIYETFPEANNRCDLVAYFFRRSFFFLRSGGALGLIASNTIAQGDTRVGGLRWICKHGGEIFCARRRVRWPGIAAVVVSIVHVAKDELVYAKRLDEGNVDIISAFLFHRGGNDDPSKLLSNAGYSYSGAKIYGQGFIFDDTDHKGITTPLAEMRRLIEVDKCNAEVIFPYIGGEEVNTSPTHAYHRYVINFGERGEEECRRRWPGLMAIVEAKVRPERIQKSAEIAAWPWWRFWRSRSDMYKAIGGLDQILVNSQVSSHVQFAFLSPNIVFSHAVNVFALSTYASFCSLQSRPHESWARFFGSSMKDDLRYTPSDCFETFPFPDNWETRPSLEDAGKTYYEFRAALMLKDNEGLTRIYNRLHDPYEDSPDILRLRELHSAMDRAVLDAYGWQDIPTACEFLLDYEIDEEEWGDKKKPWRHRWPDDVRDEVLARLLELNAKRAKEEQFSDAAAAKKGRGRKGKPKSGPESSGSGDLFS
ncbi:MAG TPA: DNA methyltransferase [Thermoanaerobaculia bacterium]